MTPSDSSMDKRPKLERAHSAAEKENQPLLRASGGGALRRQLSQQETRCYGELDGLARSHPHLLQPRHKAGYAPEEPRRSPHPAHLPPRSSSSDEDAPECVSDENDEFRDRGECSPFRRASRPLSSILFVVLNHTHFHSTIETGTSVISPQSIMTHFALNVSIMKVFRAGLCATLSPRGPQPAAPDLVTYLLHLTYDHVS